MTVVRLTIYKPCWHGFARWRLRLVEGHLSTTISDGWCWRGWWAQFEEWQWLTADTTHVAA